MYFEELIASLTSYLKITSDGSKNKIKNNSIKELEGNTDG